MKYEIHGLVAQQEIFNGIHRAFEQDMLPKDELEYLKNISVIDFIETRNEVHDPSNTVVFDSFEVAGTIHLGNKIKIKDELYNIRDAYFDVTNRCQIVITDKIASTVPVSTKDKKDCMDEMVRQIRNREDYLKDMIRMTTIDLTGYVDGRN